VAEHAEGVGPNIDATVFLHDVTPPGLVDDFTGRVVLRLVTLLLGAKPIIGGKQWPTRRRRFEGDVCEDLGQITPDRTVVLRQLGEIDIVRRPD
jgi:hypothetical protein